LWSHTFFAVIYLVVSGDMHVAYAVARDLSRGFRRHECRGTNKLRNVR